MKKIMQKQVIVTLGLLLLLSTAAAAQEVAVEGTASYWGGHYWVGLSAKSALTDNITVRGSFYYRANGNSYYRGKADVLYALKGTGGFDSYVGVGAGYSSSHGTSIDLTCGAKITTGKNAGLSGEAVYTIFLNEAYDNSFGFNLGFFVH